MVYSVHHNVYCEILSTVSLLLALCIFGNGRLPIYHKFYASLCNVKTFNEVKNVYLVLWEIYLDITSKFRRNQQSFTEDMTKQFWLIYYCDMVFEFSQNTTFKIYKVAYRHYSGGVENIKCLTLWHVYSGHCIANFISISHVLQKKKI